MKKVRGDKAIGGTEVLEGDDDGWVDDEAWKGGKIKRVKERDKKVADGIDVIEESGDDDG